jgi:acetyl-CoA carboxylase carboxyltransferase component
LISAYGAARVPLVCLVVRKSYGGGSVLSFAADVRLALPSARIGPMGADAGLEVVLGPEREDAGDEEKARRAAARAAWLERHDNVWAPASAGYVDRVVAPADVRRALAGTVSALRATGPRASRPPRASR